MSKSTERIPGPLGSCPLPRCFPCSMLDACEVVGLVPRPLKGGHVRQLAAVTERPQLARSHHRRHLRHLSRRALADGDHLQRERCYNSGSAQPRNRRVVHAV
jgi:hypothetical protein